MKKIYTILTLGAITVLFVMFFVFVGIWFGMEFSSGEDFIDEDSSKMASVEERVQTLKKHFKVRTEILDADYRIGFHTFNNEGSYMVAMKVHKDSIGKWRLNCDSTIYNAPKEHFKDWYYFLDSTKWKLQGRCQRCKSYTHLADQSILLFHYSAM